MVFPVRGWLCDTALRAAGGDAGMAGLSFKLPPIKVCPFVCHSGDGETHSGFKKTLEFSRDFKSASAAAFPAPRKGHFSELLPSLRLSKLNRSTASLWRWHFLASWGSQNVLAPHLLLLQVREQSTHGRLTREREGRRGAFLGGHTYSGLLFFSSSESELWWWIQLLSPFRVVRTFICLMILLRSSSVGGMARPRRGRGKGRREEKGC